MDRFLAKFSLPRLYQEEIEIMNNPITSTEMKTMIKKISPKNKSPGPDGFTGEFYQAFREELMPIVLKLFQKIAEEHFQTHSMRPPSPWHQNQTKTRKHTKRKLQASITEEHRCKILNKILANTSNSATHQKAHTPWSHWVYSRDARILQYMQVNQCDTPH